MEKSPQIINLAKAVIKFKTKCPKIPKKSKNPFFKSMYAALPDIQDVVDPVLNDVGLTYTQHPEPGDKLTTVLIHADSGEFMQSTIDINPVYEYKEEKDNNRKVIWRSEHAYVSPQTMGSAITYAKRYALVSILGLNVDDDDDGNAGSGKEDNAQQTKQAAALPELKPDNKKLWDNLIFGIRAGKLQLNVVLGQYTITSEDKAKFEKTAAKPNPSLKPGTEAWNKCVKYLATKQGAKLDDITFTWSLTDQDAIDLKEDAINYVEPETTNTTK